MDTEIQFGQLEQVQPERRLRPDQNKHYAIADYASPKDSELAVFIDMDVMRDMETHAQSNTNVELGGVLLGGQYEDKEGRPFVLISDSLRAAHYEATKGSFKFTHDTWSEITRQREQFPPDLQMVGWYHTHPGWGVFLSGMDMFICENFFNKPLDVALVIDPCGNDRGVFQWEDETAKNVRRIGGYHLIASRFRQAELEKYAAQLEGKLTMAADYQTGGSGPIVHVGQPAPAWTGAAVWGALSIQFALLVLIAWRMLFPNPPSLDDARATRLALAQLEQINRDEILDAKAEYLDTVVQHLARTPAGTIPAILDEQAGRRELESELAGQQALAREQQRAIGGLESSIDDMKRGATSLRIELDRLAEDKANLVEIRVAQRQKIDELEDEVRRLSGTTEEPEDGSPASKWDWKWIGAGGAALLVAVGAAAALWQSSRLPKEDHNKMDVDDNEDGQIYTS